jgi:hypothetical protein
MTLGGREILARLLDLTPVPTPGADVEQLIAAFEVIMSGRGAIIALILPPISVTEADRPLVVELARRQTLWQEALAAAQHTVGDQRCGADHLRAYARTV